MNIIAFDLGTTYAYASQYGVQHATLGVKKSTRQEKLAEFQKELSSLRAVNRFDAVVYERPFARGQAATRMLWGMAGIIEAVFAPVAAVLDYAPTEIKKWATGNGKAEKADMIEYARMFGYTGDNEHEADAFCLLKFAEQELTGG